MKTQKRLISLINHTYYSQKLILFIFVSLIISITYSKEFVWVHGSDYKNGQVRTGPKGVPSPLNIPASRKDLVLWKDSSGDIYIFGGYSYLYYQGNKKSLCYSFYFRK